MKISEHLVNILCMAEGPVTFVMFGDWFKKLEKFGVVERVVFEDGKGKCIGWALTEKGRGMVRE